MFELIAAQKLDVDPSECMVIEDSDAGVEAAKAGGMYAIAVGAAEHNPKADVAVASIGSLNKALSLLV